ncbi:hypothetical protein K502DRAFT_166943 [Neoconidiobolus thromboides FSU 785]|nr:hypothetical protein K502DRAFT_166943 [Neoconidiobolus thromboides FSU 785]
MSDNDAKLGHSGNIFDLLKEEHESPFSGLESDKKGLGLDENSTQDSTQENNETEKQSKTKVVRRMGKKNKKADKKRKVKNSETILDPKILEEHSKAFNNRMKAPPVECFFSLKTNRKITQYHGTKIITEINLSEDEKESEDAVNLYNTYEDDITLCDACEDGKCLNKC